MGGIVVFWDVGVFAWIDGGDFVGLLGDFSDWFREGRLRGFLFALEGEVLDLLFKFFLFLFLYFFEFFLLFVFFFVEAFLDLFDGIVEVEAGEFEEGNGFVFSEVEHVGKVVDEFVLVWV